MQQNKQVSIILPLQLSQKLKEPLIKSGRKRLRVKTFKFEALIARNSRAIAKISNEGVECFGLNIFVHDLIRGSVKHAGK